MIVIKRKASSSMLGYFQNKCLEGVKCRTAYSILTDWTTADNFKEFFDNEGCIAVASYIYP
jgi:heme-degrading monooxygenase HmoA